MSQNDSLNEELDENVEILIVDDRKQDLAALRSVLSEPGYTVTTAASGDEALWLLLNRDFAVILLDVVMPRLDGFDLARMIKARARNRHTPLIFLTAAGLDVNRLYRAYSIGAIDYLMKPVDALVVRAKVAVFADLHRKNERLLRQAQRLRESEQHARELEIDRLRLISERRYRNLAEAIPQIVWTADSHGLLTYCNQSWMRYTGLDLLASYGLRWLQAVHQEDAERTEQSWRMQVELGETCELRCRLRNAETGLYRWHVCHAVPERDESGAIVAWLVTGTDFEDLLQAIQARDEFLAIASHELRTPLTALKLRIQSLERSGSFDAAAHSKIVSASAQLRRLERLIAGLLDVARIATGQLDIEFAEFGVNAVVEEVIGRVKAATSAKPVISFAAGDVNDSVHWDRLRFEQVLTNLLDNAVRYGDGKPIEVRVTSDHDELEISVIDRGLGIADQDVARIFDRFERVGQRRVPGGLGMGLYITRKIVEAHRGSIHVCSELGKGSRFSIRLPRDPQAMVDAAS
jgi:PAS domain S-box-containing protein